MFSILKQILTIIIITSNRHVSLLALSFPSDVLFGLYVCCGAILFQLYAILHFQLFTNWEILQLMKFLKFVDGSCTSKWKFYAFQMKLKDFWLLFLKRNNGGNIFKCCCKKRYFFKVGKKCVGTSWNVDALDLFSAIFNRARKVLKCFWPIYEFITLVAKSH